MLAMLEGDQDFMSPTEDISIHGFESPQDRFFLHPCDSNPGDQNSATNYEYFLDHNCSDQNKFIEILNTPIPNQIVVPVIYCVICLVGLVGNGLVIFVIVGSKEMTKSVANIYILNLAVADTLLLVTLPFSSTQRVLLSWPFGVGMCKIVEAVKYLNYFASIFFLTAMSLDRCLAVVYVVTSSRFRTNKNTFFVCLLVWLLSFVMVIPLLIYTKLHGGMCALVFNTNIEEPKDFPLALEGYGEDYEMPYNFWNDIYEEGSTSTSITDDDIQRLLENAYLCKHPDSRTFHVFIIFTFVIGFIVPLNIIAICYTMIVARLLQPSETRSRSRQADRTRRKVTRMVVALVVVFFVCWLPFYIWHLVQIKGVAVSMHTCMTVRDFTFCLGFANSCLNPLLYTFLGHNFQERLRRSVAMSLRSLTFSTFSRYATNTLSRAETGNLTKKMEATNTEPAGEGCGKIGQSPKQIPEEEQPCIKADANANHHEKV